MNVVAIRDRYTRWWREFSMPTGKLVWFRVALFSVVAVDGFLQIAHAPRYGAGEFNVSHLSWLDGVLPLPGRSGMLAVYLLQAYLGFVVALGVTAGGVLALLAGLYGYAYFSSQLDSYQHHYLVFLLLVLACFVPWRGDPAPEPGPSEPGPSEPAEPRTASWALRLIMVQVALVYAWAAVAKHDSLWRDGTTLERQLGQLTEQGDFIRVVVEGVGYSGAAKLIAGCELALAVGWLIRRAWLPTLVVGVAFHIGVELAEFRIGIFSYFMFALYILLVPDRVVRAVSSRWVSAGRWLRSSARPLAAIASRRAVLAVFAPISVAGGAALLTRLPFAEGTWVAGLTVAVIVCVVGWRVATGKRAGKDSNTTPIGAPFVAHLVACAAVLSIHVASDTAHDYYKYWGGSSRRLGDRAGAEQAYTKLVEISPDWGPAYYHLGNIHRAEGRIEEALASYRRAQEASPGDYRPHLQEALIHHQAGRGDEAVQAARRALALGPRNQRDRDRARAVVRRWASSPR